MSKKSQKQNLQTLDVIQQPQPDDENRQTAILFEYKMLQMYGPLLGIYAIPNLENYMMWNCIIFVRKGFYKDGKFKFNLVFSEEFPKKAPRIFFISKMYHCLVRENDGEIDLQALLMSKWDYLQENMLYNVFSGLEKMFIEKERMEISDSLNPAASHLLQSKPHNFIEKALSCVDYSQDNLYVNEPGTSLIINKYEKGQLNPYKEKLQSLCEQNRPPEEKRKEFLMELLKE